MGNEINKENQQRELKIRADKRYSTVIENYDEFDYSIFKDAYAKADKLVVNIIKRNKKFEMQFDNMNRGRMNEYSDYHNNIISFIGDRGSGKTSCMTSYVEALMQSRYIQEIMNDDNGCRCNFFKTPTIDPAAFEDNGNIIKIIVASMFSEFKTRIRTEKENSSQYERRDILDAFGKVYDNLKFISNKSSLDEFSSIEALDKLAESSTLRDSLKSLVELYLNYFNDNRDATKKYLLVTIDDIDLEPKYAYEMVEQVRKYLMLTNVIIFLSFKFEQLKDTIHENLLQQFTNQGRYQRKYHDSVDCMADKYMEKLFPQGQRIEMMDVISSNFKMSIVSDEKIFEANSFEEGLRNLIYTRTGLMFMNTDFTISPIIPKSLRGAVQLAIWLYDLEACCWTLQEVCVNFINAIKKSKIPYDMSKYHEALSGLYDIIYSVNNSDSDGEAVIKKLELINSQLKSDDANNSNYNIEIINHIKEKVQKNQNDVDDICYFIRRKQSHKINEDNEKQFILAKKQREMFIKYFGSTWVSVNLHKEHIDIITNWINMPDRQKNKNIVTGLDEIFRKKYLSDVIVSKSDRIERESDKYQEYFKIISKTNTPENVSFGDVLLVLHWLDNLSSDITEKHLIMAIKIYYSCFLYENYLEYINNHSYTGYFELIGRDVYNPKEYKLLNEDSHIRILAYRRTIKKIIEPIFELSVIKKIFEGVSSEEQLKNEPNYKEYVESLSEAKDKLLMIEAIHYFISYYREPSDLHRDREEIYHLTEIDIAQRSYATFDVFAFLRNLPKYEDTLKRVYYKDKEHSLYALFKSIEESKLIPGYKPIYLQYEIKIVNHYKDFYIGTVEVLENLLAINYKKNMGYDDEIAYGESVYAFLKNFFSKLINIQLINESFKKKSINENILINKMASELIGLMQKHLIFAKDDFINEGNENKEIMDKVIKELLIENNKQTSIYLSLINLKNKYREYFELYPEKEVSWHKLTKEIVDIMNTMDKIRENTDTYKNDFKMYLTEEDYNEKARKFETKFYSTFYINSKSRLWNQMFDNYFNGTKQESLELSQITNFYYESLRTAAIKEFRRVLFFR